MNLTRTMLNKDARFRGLGSLGSVAYTDAQIQGAIGYTYDELVASGWSDNTITAFMANKLAWQQAEPWYLSLLNSAGEIGVTTFEKLILPTLGVSKVKPPPTAELSFMSKYGYAALAGVAGIGVLMLVLRRK